LQTVSSFGACCDISARKRSKHSLQQQVP
jgi:hypothetical protein